MGRAGLPTGHEGELVKIVVEKVLLELKKNYTHVPDNLVGIDEHINKMEGLLNSDSNGVKVVGIHGMGGLGKTTIAKVIYNQICKHFERSCFLEDVREKSQHHNGITNLQNQLLTKILNREISNIVEVYEGINRIKGNCDWFGAGSRIIVTTRNKDVLDVLEVTCQREGLLDVYRSYEPRLMNDDHSLQLFSKYAFMRDSPPEGYYILAKEVVCTAAGLPLVLVTIGSSLFGKQDKALWEERLRKLKNIPHQQVLEKLRITFEALEYEQKQIFLDIACLFVGEDKTSPCYMWDDCEFYPISGINVLVLRSLVKVGDDNTLRMHDQLRDLGRQIVREESLDEPGECSRLWRHEEALDLFERRMLTRKVKALCLDLRPDLELDSDIQSQCLVGGDFGQVLNLRFLRLGCADLEGDFKHLLSNLRWLQWSCEMNFTPTNFHLKNLVILDLSGSQITDDWKGWSGIKMSRKLKVLNLSHCYGLRRVTLFSTFATLERLSLSSCKSLEEIKLSSGNLINLRVLDLSNCRRLGNLDCSMFTALESLDVQWCERLRRLDGFEQLVSLKYLNISFCRSLVRISHLPNFKKLERLDFRKCDINAYFNYWT